MTRREMQLFALAIENRRKYLDSNPDVGMGPSIWFIAKSMAGGLDFEITDAEIRETIERYGLN